MSRNQSVIRRQKGRKSKGRGGRTAEEPLSGQALTIKQVANSLQVSVKTVQRLIKAGKLDTIKVGREYRILPEAFGEFLQVSRASVDTSSM
jgi:excisionase family DNA binding protein